MRWVSQSLKGHLVPQLIVQSSLGGFTDPSQLDGPLHGTRRAAVALPCGWQCYQCSFTAMDDLAPLHFLLLVPPRGPADVKRISRTVRKDPSRFFFFISFPLPGQLFVLLYMFPNILLTWSSVWKASRSLSQSNPVN